MNNIIGYDNYKYIMNTITSFLYNTKIYDKLLYINIYIVFDQKLYDKIYDIIKSIMIKIKIQLDKKYNIVIDNDNKKKYEKLYLIISKYIYIIIINLINIYNFNFYNSSTFRYFYKNDNVINIFVKEIKNNDMSCKDLVEFIENSQKLVESMKLQ